MKDKDDQLEVTNQQHLDSSTQIIKQSEPTNDLTGEILNQSTEKTLPGTRVSAKVLTQDTRPIKLRTDKTATTSHQNASEFQVNQTYLHAAEVTHVGNIRTRNEDSTNVFTAVSSGQEPMVPFGFYLVADGMGGHYAGHEASRYVARFLTRKVIERIYLPLLRNSIDSNGSPPEPIRDVMLDAVQQANRHIFNPLPEKVGGTTLTAALILGRRLYITHVGDSRAYLSTDGKLKQVTDDHSYVHRLLETGQITEAEAASHPQRNMLYRAVGQGDDLEIDTFTRTLPQKGLIMLCSDGLWGLVAQDLLADVLEGDLLLESKAEELVGLALEAGGYDNISVVLVEFCFGD